MPDRTTLVKTAAPGGYAGWTDLTLAAADVAAPGNRIVAGGNDLIVAFNSTAVGRTFTLNSVACPHGRVLDITAEAVAGVIGTIRIYGPLPAEGWRQAANQYIYCAGDAVTLLLGVIAL